MQRKYLFGISKPLPNCYYRWFNANGRFSADATSVEEISSVPMERQW